MKLAAELRRGLIVDDLNISGTARIEQLERHIRHVLAVDHPQSNQHVFYRMTAETGAEAGFDMQRGRKLRRRRGPEARP